MAKARRKKSNADQPVPLAPLAWIKRMKYRAFALLVALGLATVATVTFVGAPWAPVIGVAFAAACVSISKLTKSLGHPMCLECGHDLSNQPVSVQGIACPTCGSVNSPGLVQLAEMGDPQGKQHAEQDEA